MTIYIGKKEYNFTPEQLNSMYLDEGYEANVYRLGNIILKIYKDKKVKARLDYETAKKLSKMKTKRIQMPRQPIFDHNGVFLGHTALYLTPYSPKNIARMNMQKFIEEVQALDDDLKLLSSNYIDAMDLTLDNTIYTGDINLCDPGSYLVRDNKPIQYIRNFNSYELKKYLGNELLPNIIHLTRKQQNNLTKNFLASDSLVDYLEETAVPTEKVSTYVKRISK